MLQTVSDYLSSALAKFPKDQRFPIDLVRDPRWGMTPVQKGFLLAYGDRFTASELGALMRKSATGIGGHAQRLGVKLQVKVRVYGQRQVAPESLAEIVEAGGSDAVSGSRIADARAESVRLAPLRHQTLADYVPAKADFEAGWWLNNAILHKMGVRKLGADGCSFISGDTGKGGRWKYCGGPRVHGSVYCENHLACTRAKVVTEKDQQNG